MHSCCKSHFPFRTEKLVSHEGWFDQVIHPVTAGQIKPCLFLIITCFMLCLVAYYSKDYTRIYTHGLPLYIMLLTPQNTAPMRISRPDPFSKCTMQPHMFSTVWITPGHRIRLWNMRGPFHFICLAWIYNCISGEIDVCHTKIFQWFNI